MIHSSEIHLSHHSVLVVLFRNCCFEVEHGHWAPRQWTTLPSIDPNSSRTWANVTHRPSEAKPQAASAASDSFSGSPSIPQHCAIYANLRTEVQEALAEGLLWHAVGRVVLYSRLRRHRSYKSRPCVRRTLSYCMILVLVRWGFFLTIARTGDVCVNCISTLARRSDVGQHDRSQFATAELRLEG